MSDAATSGHATAVPHQCDTCEHWLMMNSVDRTGRCCTVNSGMYREITLDSDGCNKWERLQESGQ